MTRPLNSVELSMIAAVALSMSGCVSFVRTGQLFLTTRENCSFVSYRPCAEGMVNPLRFFGLPFVAVGTVTFAPAYDLVCLPVDLTLKAFGTRVSVVGEDGLPIGGVEVTCMGDRLWESWLDEGRYNTGVWAPFLNQGWISVTKPGYYDSSIGIGSRVKSRSDNDSAHLTVTLQRVEHPIPLWVKQVALRDFERGIGGFDGTNSVLRFDLVKGDWLPPYGGGEVADLCIGARVNRTGSERRFLPQEGAWGVLQFYDFIVKLEFGDGDYLLQEEVKESAGIKIRSAANDGEARSIMRTKGKRKQIDSSQDWHCEYFSDEDSKRCYTFRIRSRCNEKGELVEAYYGKIYGDLQFEGDDKKGLIGVRFCYYLNPTSLDRNLEWDMKTNLCPNPGYVRKEP